MEPGGLPGGPGHLCLLSAVTMAEYPGPNV